MSKFSFFGILVFMINGLSVHAETEMQRYQREASENAGVPVHVWLLNEPLERDTAIEVFKKFKQVDNFSGCVDFISVSDTYKRPELGRIDDGIELPASLSIAEINSAVKNHCVTESIKESAARVQNNLGVPFGFVHGAGECTRAQNLSSLKILEIINVGDISNCISKVLLNANFDGRSENTQDLVYIKCGSSRAEFESFFKRECK